MRKVAQVFGFRVIHALFKEHIRGGNSVFICIGQFDRHGRKAVAILEDAFGHRLKHTRVADNFGKIVVGKVRFELRRRNERALHNLMHGGLGRFGNSILLLHTRFSYDVQKHPVLIDRYADEHGCQQKKHQSDEQDRSLLQASECNAQYLFHAGFLRLLPYRSFRSIYHNKPKDPT